MVSRLGALFKSSKDKSNNQQQQQGGKEPPASPRPTQQQPQQQPPPLLPQEVTAAAASSTQSTSATPSPSHSRPTSATTTTTPTQATAALPPPITEVIYEREGGWMLSSFEKFLSAQMCLENLKFVRDADTFFRMDRPNQELAREARRLYEKYIVPAAPFEINIGGTIKQKIQQLMDANKAATKGADEAFLGRDIFEKAKDDAVRLMMNGLYPQWLATGEWRSLKLKRNERPSMDAMIRTDKLRETFAEHIRQREGTNPVALQLAVKAVEFVTEADTFFRSMPGRASRGDDLTSEADSMMTKYCELKEQGLIDTSFIPPKAGPIEVLQCSKRCVHQVLTDKYYDSWITSNLWIGATWDTRIRQQTRGHDGYIQPPTLAATLLSEPLSQSLREFATMRKDDRLVVFLQEAFNFERHFTEESTSNKKLLKAATELHEDFFQGPLALKLPQLSTEELGESNAEQLDKDLAIHMTTSKITPTVFRRVASYLYQLFSQTTYSEWLSTYVWSDSDYDNLSHDAQDMVKAFNTEIKFGISSVPSPEDVRGNPALMASFMGFLPTDSAAEYLEFLLRSSEYAIETNPGILRRDAASLYELFDHLKVQYPVLESESRPLFKAIYENDGSQSMESSLFANAREAVVKLLQELYHLQWISLGSWKEISWTPAIKSSTTTTSSAASSSSPILPGEKGKNKDKRKSDKEEKKKKDSAMQIDEMLSSKELRQKFGCWMLGQVTPDQGDLWAALDNFVVNTKPQNLKRDASRIMQNHLIAKLDIAPELLARLELPDPIDNQFFHGVEQFLYSDLFTQWLKHK